MEWQKVILDLKIKNKLESIQYKIVSQERPTLSVSNAGGYYPIKKSTPTFILQTENGFVGCLTSFQNGHLNLVRLKKLFDFQKLELADREKIKSITGYDVGTIPLIGLGLPCLFNRKLLRHDFIFGGADDELLTLEISPGDLLEVSEIIGMFG